MLGTLFGSEPLNSFWQPVNSKSVEEKSTKKIADKDFKKTRQGDRVERSYPIDLVNETNEFKVVVKK